MGDTLELGPEAIGILRLAADVDGEQGAPVEAVAGGDDLVLLRAVDIVGVAASQLEGRLVGLGAGVGEEHPLGEGGVHQLARQAQGRLVGEDVGNVPDALGLLGERLDQRRMRVAQEVTAMPPAKSISSRPLWSQTRDPSPRTGMKAAGA